MSRIVHGADGAIWEVSPSGRHTQYGVDELTLEFLRVDGGSSERRFARFSPRGSKSPELALDEASDRSLAGLLTTSQPAWTSPDGGYTERV